MTNESTGAGRGASPPSPRRPNALIIRESDVMRDGLAGQLVQVTPDELEIALAAAIPLREQIKIRVLNEVQKFEKQVRGTVTECASAGGQTRIKVELLTRLTPLDVSLLRQGLLSQSASDGARWL